MTETQIEIIRQHLEENPNPVHTPVPLTGPVTAERSPLAQSLVIRDQTGAIVAAIHVALPYMSPLGETENQRKVRHETLVAAIMEQLNENQG